MADNVVRFNTRMDLIMQQSLIVSEKAKEFVHANRAFKSMSSAEFQNRKATGEAFSARESAAEILGREVDKLRGIEKGQRFYSLPVVLGCCMITAIITAFIVGALLVNG